MPRELVWLDNDTFAAWGCSGCSWIVSKPGPVREQAPAGVKEAFDQHDCANQPRLQPQRRREA